MLLDHLHGMLSDRDMATARKLVDVGEHVVGFEFICAQLEEFEIPVSKAMLGTLNSLGTRLGLSESVWADISPATK